MIYVQYDGSGNITGIIDQDSPPASDNQIMVTEMPASNMMVDITSKTLKLMPTNDDAIGLTPSPPPTPQ